MNEDSVKRHLDGSDGKLFFAMDTGGTMTDAFIVDEHGEFSVGKAQTTPELEANGILVSFEDALGSWSMATSEAASRLDAVLYSGTIMLNRLVSRTGEAPIGVITTAGFEDVLRFGRGKQSYANFSYAERLHARSHFHPEPIVPRGLVRGVRGRVHFSGLELIPLFEDEAREAVQYLLGRGVKAICVGLLFSHQNPVQEQRVRELAAEVMAEAGIEVPVYLSSESHPVRGELARINSMVIDVYAARPSRGQFERLRDRLRGLGSQAAVRVLTAYGGMVAPEHDWLVSTVVSGPIGGMIGAKYLGEALHTPNLVCADIGGTSFDVGLITEGEYTLRQETPLASFIMSVPMLAMESIGAGTGTFVRLDPVISRVNLGPESAGYRVGMSNPMSGLTVPTVTDCHVVLGHVDPDYFLGGQLQLDRRAAESALRAELADPLGTTVEESAWGVIQLLETDFREHLSALILGAGYAPENYDLLMYGGGGPLHVASISKGMHFQDVLVPSWAAAFSAFGCATADFSYRFERSVDQVLSPDGSQHGDVAELLNEVWADLRAQLEAEFRRDGLDPATMEFRPSLRLLYRGMLDDLEVPVERAALVPEDLDAILAEYDQRFERMFARAAKSPEAGYVVTKAIAVGIHPHQKPQLPSIRLGSATPPERARKQAREIYWDTAWVKADIWEMDLLHPGSVVTGPAVIEAPATTLLVPPGFEAQLDTHRVFHIKEV
jgi:N-methylhydantoinase A/oxoprolinase/acetone carboxylase beta subunit